MFQKGTSTVKRQRTYERRILGSGPTSKLQYTVLIDQTYRKIKIGTKLNESTDRGALVGQIVYGFRDELHHWRLFLKGRTATKRQAVELIEIESYENRRLFQASPVKVGDTWSFEPGFVRNFIERDLGPAYIDAKMTLKSVETIDGEPTAVLSFTIQTNARKAIDNSRISSAIIDLHGTLYVSLTTMLDKKMTMAGTVTTTTRQNGITSTIASPVTYIVTKTIR